jgi:hypothetical protein
LPFLFLSIFLILRLIFHSLLFFLLPLLLNPLLPFLKKIAKILIMIVFNQLASYVDDLSEIKVILNILEMLQDDCELVFYNEVTA